LTKAGDYTNDRPSVVGEIAIFRQSKIANILQGVRVHGFMEMTVWDFRGKHKVESVLQLESVLSDKYAQNRNCFWLTHNDEKHPTLALLVNGELATLNYFPREGHPGFVPAEGLGNVSGAGTTAFSIDEIEQESEIPNEQVVSFAKAVTAAKNFFELKQLPQSMKWREL
jgi:hypothetical protein